MKVIAFSQGPNNKLAVAYPADVDLTIEQIAQRILPSGQEYAILKNLQVDNDFFDAYQFIKGQIVLNYELAKEIQKNKWREARKPMLEKLDVDYMKALEIGDLQKQKEISTQKQQLRDVTNIVMIDNLDMIKSTWPNILKVV
jgi:hypothetical protein